VVAVQGQEIEPGLVVRLETTVLRALGGCETNAESTPAEDRAVQGPHYFLVLEVDHVAARALAVPLFSKPAPGSEMLDEAKKAGEPTGWIGTTSYFSRWQHWWIPVGLFAPSSRSETSPRANRRMYAASAPADLAAIARWRVKNRAPFRAL
jgi:hypothetical protein